MSPSPRARRQRLRCSLASSDAKRLWASDVAQRHQRRALSTPARETHSGGRCPAPAGADGGAPRHACRGTSQSPSSARLKVIETEGDGVERARQRVELAESELAAFLLAVSAAARRGADAFSCPPRVVRRRGDRHSASQHARRDRAMPRRSLMASGAGGVGQPRRPRAQPAPAPWGGCRARRWARLAHSARRARPNSVAFGADTLRRPSSVGPRPSRAAAPTQR